MSYFVTSSAYGTTGVKTITCGFQPTHIRITVGQKVATSQAFTHFSYGIAWDDSGPQMEYHSFFQDTTSGKTDSDTTFLWRVWERQTGTITEVAAGTFDSFTATAGKINVTNSNANYNLIIELWN